MNGFVKSNFRPPPIRSSTFHDGARCWVARIASYVGVVFVSMSSLLSG